MKKWEKEAIKKIMDNFDFEKVQKVMKLLKWSWVSEPIPLNTGTIKKEANRLLTEICNKKRNSDFYWIATGGFKVSIFPKSKILRLEFIVIDWDNE